MKTSQEPQDIIWQGPFLDGHLLVETTPEVGVVSYLFTNYDIKQHGCVELPEYASCPEDAVSHVLSIIECDYLQNVMRFKEEDISNGASTH